VTHLKTVVGAKVSPLENISVVVTQFLQTNAVYWHFHPREQVTLNCEEWNIFWKARVQIWNSEMKSKGPKLSLPNKPMTMGSIEFHLVNSIFLTVSTLSHGRVFTLGGDYISKKYMIAHFHAVQLTTTQHQKLLQPVIFHSSSLIYMSWI